MTEREAYEILSRPYIRIGEIGKLLGTTSGTARRHVKKAQVRMIHAGVYVTADFIKKFSLDAYWKQVSRFAAEE